MKKIGLVGGTGPESTLMYYKKLNTEIDRLTDGKNMPDIAIESVNFRRAWDYVVQDRFDLLTDYLLEKVNSLIAGGAEIISLSAVTMHAVYKELEKRSGIKLVSIPKAVSDEIVSKGIKKIGLLGTVFTMEQDYMKNDLVNAGVQVVVPNSNERELIGKRIFEELENGIVKQSTLLEFTDIINRMKKEDGIEGVILGCTELPLLLNSENSPVQCFDSGDIHLKKLIQMAMEL
ncbi:MAG: amino acid racemase [Lachnospiraceae bacterium]|nr:amino acid racemase [Lachnospiraceae bacterium]